MKPFWLAITMALIAVTSCKKDKKRNELSVDKTEVAIPGLLNGETSIQITTNAAWKIDVEGNPDWLQVDPASGTGNATVKLKNKVSNPPLVAEAKLTLSAEFALPVTIRVTRKPLFSKPVLRTLAGSQDDQFNGGVATADGGYILVGSTRSEDFDFPRENSTNIDGIAVKYSASGTIEWEKRYGDESDDILLSVTLTEDGGYLMCGSSNSYDGDFGDNKGGFDYWILKTDKDGNKLWNKVYGSDEENTAQSCVAVNGGYIIAGITHGEGEDVSQHYGQTDAWVIKLDNAGALLWEKSFGGALSDGARSLIRTADGHCVLAGYYESSEGGGAEGPQGWIDGWLLKFDVNGNKIWSKRYGGTHVDVFYSLQATPNGELIAAGVSLSNDGQLSGNHGMEDGMVIKTAADGQLQWARLIGGERGDQIQSVLYHADKGIMVTGFTQSEELPGYKDAYDAMLSWLDNSGKAAEIRLIGGTMFDGGYFLLKTTGNRYVVGGSSQSNDGDFPVNRGMKDCWLIEFE